MAHSENCSVIGLLGGMSWESSATYYRLLNEGIRDRFGELHSAEILLRSVNFSPVAQLQQEERWKEVGELLVEEAKRLEAAGCGCLLLCTNTMHIVAAEIESEISVPFIHIADGVGQFCRQDNIVNAGLLGTRYTMEKDFYSRRLRDRFEVGTVVPDAAERSMVHEVIYEELCRGVVRDESRQQYIEVSNRLAERGAQAIVLGCTEIGMLIRQSDLSLPVLDSAELHAQAAVEWAARRMSE